MPAVKLARGKKIEESGEKPDPRGATNGMEEQIFRSDARMKQSSKCLQEQGHSEDGLSSARVRQAGDKLRVHHAVKKSLVGANGRTNQNESAERTDKRRKRNEKRIAGADAMVAAGKEMAEFVSQQYGHQSQSERQTVQQRHRMAVQ